MNTEMATLRKDMQVIVLNFEKRINILEEKLHSAKDDLDGAKARIEMLEAEIEMVMQTKDRRIPAEVTALEFTSVVEAPPFPVVTGPAPAPVVAPQSESADEPCRWHKQTEGPRVKPQYEGGV